MNYSIIEAGIDDIEVIVDVTIQSFEDPFNKPFYLEREAAINRWKAYIRKEHGPRGAKDPRIIYVALADGEIVGFIAGHLTERLGLEGELESIYILPEHQRQKLGTQLVIALAKWFTDSDRLKPSNQETETRNRVAVLLHYSNSFRKIV